MAKYVFSVGVRYEKGVPIYVPFREKKSEALNETYETRELAGVVAERRNVERGSISDEKLKLYANVGLNLLELKFKYHYLSEKMKEQGDLYLSEVFEIEFEKLEKISQL